MVAALKELWTKNESEYHGKYYDFPAVYSFPKPAATPYPPIILGSKASNVFKRIAKWGDGWLPLDITTEEVVHGRSELDRLAELNGRDPNEIEISVMGVPADPESIERYAEAGADRVILGVGGEENDIATMEEIAEKVM